MLRNFSTTRETASHAMTTHAIIHLFALAHAVVALASRSLHYYDDIPLTLLTISMVAIISVRHRMQLETTVISILAACFLGYLAGIYGALWLRIVFRNDLLAPMLTTFLITEFTGWCTYLIASRQGGKRPIYERWGSSSRYIILIALLVLILRVGYMLILNHIEADTEIVFGELRRLFSSSLAVLFLLSANTLGVHLYFRFKAQIRPAWSHPLWIMLFLIAISLLTAWGIIYSESLHTSSSPSFQALFRLTISILLVAIACYALISLAYHLIYSRRELTQERSQRHMAQYQFSKFKQQINPHFLFNSLNILNVLVQEGENQRASTFIRKLAGIYRYMLRSEAESLVTLREEMEFAGMYIDLIKERFSDGLIIQQEIPSEALSLQIVPCSVQQLLENATKHNIVSSEEPLKITLRIEEGYLRVENNLQPRISLRSGSTHLGLKIISQQYSDICGQEIRIRKDDTTFSVDLPLLKSVKA
uniref:sensor histidine kinase n=1 Tax=Alistipes sp. TaxID=1872444 RepID=UPI0040564E96